MANEPALVTTIVTRVLEKLNVRYLIGGSLASTLYGMVRTTQDSDIVAELKPEQIESFIIEVKNEFLLQYLRQLRGWNPHINMMNTAQRGHLSENLLQ